MNERLVDRIPFAKIITVLAIIFGVSLGLCGVTAMFASRMRTNSNFLVSFGMIELVGILGSAAGLVGTTALWVVLTAVGSFGGSRSESQRIFDGRDDESKKDRE
jgi:hypothetical protein